MRPIIVFAAIVLGMATSSCNKSYICECLNLGNNSLEHFDIKASQKSDAESKCAEHNGDPNGTGLGNCQLK